MKLLYSYTGVLHPLYYTKDILPQTTPHTAPCQESPSFQYPEAFAGAVYIRERRAK